MTGKRLHGDVKQWPHESPDSHATLYRSHLQAAAGLDIFSGNRFDCDKNSFRLRPDLVWRLYAPKPLHCILKQFCASYTGTWNYHKFGLSKHPFKSISKVCLEFCIWFLLKDAWCIEAWVSLQSTCKFLSHCKNRKKGKDKSGADSRWTQYSHLLNPTVFPKRWYTKSFYSETPYPANTTLDTTTLYTWIFYSNL